LSYSCVNLASRFSRVDCRIADPKLLLERVRDFSLMSSIREPRRAYTGGQTGLRVSVLPTLKMLEIIKALEAAYPSEPWIFPTHEIIINSF